MTLFSNSGRFIKWVDLKYSFLLGLVRPYKLTDRLSGFGPENRGSIPRGAVI